MPLLIATCRAVITRGPAIYGPRDCLFYCALMVIRLRISTCRRSDDEFTGLKSLILFVLCRMAQLCVAMNTPTLTDEDSVCLTEYAGVYYLKLSTP